MSMMLSTISDFMAGHVMVKSIVTNWTVVSESCVLFIACSPFPVRYVNHSSSSHLFPEKRTQRTTKFASSCLSSSSSSSKLLLLLSADHYPTGAPSAANGAGSR